MTSAGVDLFMPEPVAPAELLQRVVRLRARGPAGH
jgi:hypothetical protein